MGPKSSFAFEVCIWKQLYYVEQKLSGNEPSWKFHYKPLLPNNKELRNFPSSFYPKFEMYNCVKCSKILYNYSIYFSNQSLKIKETYFSMKLISRNGSFMKEIQAAHIDLLWILPRFYPRKKLVLTGYYFMIPTLEDQGTQALPMAKQYLLQKFGQTQMLTKIIIWLITSALSI